MDVVLLALLLSFVPAFACAVFVYWLDRYEKEPVRLLGLVFFWGAVVAVFGSALLQRAMGGAIQTISSELTSSIIGALVLAPLTEESLKGLALFGVFLLLRDELDSLLDGLIYSLVVGLGFTASEDVLYLLAAADRGGIAGLYDHFATRTLMGIWDHSFYTSFIGMGLAASRLSRRPLTIWLAPVAGWMLACFFHMLHNTLGVLAENSPGFLLLMFLVDWSGWLFLALVVRIAARREAELLEVQLEEEVRQGRMSAEHYQTAISSLKRTRAVLRALAGGRFAATRRYYQLSGELAHKKGHLARRPESSGDRRLIEEIRAELATLEGQALA